jgi:hypothetical protein
VVLLCALALWREVSFWIPSPTSMRDFPRGAGGRLV